MIPMQNLTANECASRLHVSSSVMYEYLKNGLIKSTNVCNGTKYNRYLIQEADLEDFIRRKNSRANEYDPIPWPDDYEPPVRETKAEEPKPQSEPVKAEEPKTEFDIKALHNLLDEAVNNHRTNQELIEVKIKLKKLAEAAMEVAMMAEDLANA